MATVTSITKKTEDRARRHLDTLVLSTVARWQRSRAEARLEWAKQNEQSVFRTQSGDYSSPNDALDQVEACEAHLRNLEPMTTLGAMALLEVAADIISTRALDPEAQFAEGPVLEILVNVARSLRCKDARLRK